MEIAVASQFDSDLHHISGNWSKRYTGPAVRCGFEAEFASSIGHADFADKLALALGVNRSSVVVNNGYGASHGGDYRYWSVETDGSIAVDRDHTNKIELVSPILEIEHMIGAMEKVFDLINSPARHGIDTTVGITNASTGCHLTFSLKGVDLRSVNLVKLYLLMGPDYWGRMFGREDVTFSKAVRPIILTLIDKYRNNAFKTLSEFNNSALSSWENWSGRRHQFNITKLSNVNQDKQCLEFRLPGGPDYTKKFSLMARLARRFAYALYASTCDAYDDVFKVKLYKLIQKHAQAQDTTGSTIYMSFASKGVSFVRRTVHKDTARPQREVILSLTYEGNDVVEITPGSAYGTLHYKERDKLSDLMSTPIFRVGDKAFPWSMRSGAQLLKLSDSSITALQQGDDLMSRVILHTAISSDRDTQTDTFKRDLAELMVAAVEHNIDLMYWIYSAVEADVLNVEPYSGALYNSHNSYSFVTGLFLENNLHLSYEERVRLSSYFPVAHEIQAGLCIPNSIDDGIWFRLVFYAIQNDCYEHDIPQETVAKLLFAWVFSHHVSDSPMDGSVWAKIVSHMRDHDEILRQLEQLVGQESETVRETVLMELTTAVERLGLIYQAAPDSNLFFGAADLLADAARREGESLQYTDNLLHRCPFLRRVPDSFLEKFGLTPKDFEQDVPPVVDSASFYAMLNAVANSLLSGAHNLLNRQDVVRFISSDSFLADDEDGPSLCTAYYKYYSNYAGTRTESVILNSPILCSHLTTDLQNRVPRDVIPHETIGKIFLMAASSNESALTLAQQISGIERGQPALYRALTSNGILELLDFSNSRAFDVLTSEVGVAVIKSLIAHGSFAETSPSDVLGQFIDFLQSGSAVLGKLSRRGSSFPLFDAIASWLYSYCSSIQDTNKRTALMQAVRSCKNESNITIRLDAPTDFGSGVSMRAPARIPHVVVEPDYTPSDPQANLPVADMISLFNGDLDLLAIAKLRAALDEASAETLASVFAQVDSSKLSKVIFTDKGLRQLKNPAILKAGLRQPNFMAPFGSYLFADRYFMNDAGLPSSMMMTSFSTLFGYSLKDVVFMALAPTTALSNQINESGDFIAAVQFLYPYVGPDILFSARAALFLKRSIEASPQSFGWSKSKATVMLVKLLTALKNMNQKLVPGVTYPLINSLAKAAGFRNLESIKEFLAPFTGTEAA